jgi:hypothetical protein
MKKQLIPCAAQVSIPPILFLLRGISIAWLFDQSRHSPAEVLSRRPTMRKMRCMMICSSMFILFIVAAIQVPLLTPSSAANESKSFGDNRRMALKMNVTKRHYV